MPSGRVERRRRSHLAAQSGFGSFQEVGPECQHHKDRARRRQRGTGEGSNSASKRADASALACCRSSSAWSTTISSEASCCPVTRRSWSATTSRRGRADASASGASQAGRRVGSIFAVLNARARARRRTVEWRGGSARAKWRNHQPVCRILAQAWRDFPLHQRTLAAAGRANQQQQSRFPLSLETRQSLDHSLDLSVASKEDARVANLEGEHPWKRGRTDPTRNCRWDQDQPCGDLQTVVENPRSHRL